MIKNKLKRFVFILIIAGTFVPFRSFSMQQYLSKIDGSSHVFKPSLSSVPEESLILPGESILDISFERWRELDLSAEQLIEIMQSFIMRAKHCLSQEQLWTKDYDIVDQVMTHVSDTTYGVQSSGPFLLYASKLFVPKSNQIIIIGDLHARYDSLDVILSRMIKDGLMDENFRLKDETYFVGLGDYCDRGGMTWKTIATLLLIFLKNPDNRVFLIRGNHEDLLNSIQYYDFIKETRDTVLNANQYLTSLFTDLYKVFEFLPSALYLGQMEQGDSRSQILLLSHGGIETRYNPTSLLDKDDEELRASGGVRFDLITKKDIADWVNDVFGSGPLISDLSDYYFCSNEAFGFWWNDLNVCDDQVGILASSDRGPGVFQMTQPAIKKMLSSFDNETRAFVGSIHGHDHYIAKSIHSYFHGGEFSPFGEFLDKPTMPTIAAVDEGVLQFDYDKQVRDFDSFFVIKMISGSIYNEDHVVVYEPAFFNAVHYQGRWIFSVSCGK